MKCFDRWQFLLCSWLFYNIISTVLHWKHKQYMYRYKEEMMLSPVWISDGTGMYPKIDEVPTYIKLGLGQGEPNFCLSGGRAVSLRNLLFRWRQCNFFFGGGGEFSQGGGLGETKGSWVLREGIIPLLPCFNVWLPGISSRKLCFIFGFIVLKNWQTVKDSLAWFSAQYTS